MDTSLRPLAAEHQHPLFEEVEGTVNYSVLRIQCGDRGERGMIRNGYAIESAAVDDIIDQVTDPSGGVKRFTKFAYARHLRMPEHYATIGYDLIDRDIDFLSLLWNCGVTDDDLSTAGVVVNRWGLIDQYADATRLLEYLRGAYLEEAHYENGVIWAVLQQA